MATKITDEQYFLLKNTLNLQLQIAFQKFALLWANQPHGSGLPTIYLNKSGVFSDTYTITVAASEIRWIEERLLLLDKCYEQKMNFNATVKKIGRYLLPVK